MSWKYETDLADTVRATDTAGHTQPDSVPWNDQGYLYNAVIHHAVTVT